MSVTAENFYRRPLPPSCVDFSSDEGKQLFKESLLEGNAEIYFKLAAQFRTQDEPAYCGLSTLVMVLNALEVDPERVWKAPWRFYHESMLDCCVPLDNVKKAGVNLTQFSCLAICNRLETKMEHACETSDFLSMFRDDIISCVRGSSTVLVASYDRSVLGQTGEGHFSPIAAYHEASDRVLILDVARFKYPPHWVSVELLQKSMCSIDVTSKRSRGYLTLRLREHSRPLVMFGLKCNLSCNDDSFASSVLSWRDFLLSDPLPNREEEISLCCRKFAQCFSPHAICCTQKQIQAEAEKSHSPSSEMHYMACSSICDEIRRTKIGAVFQNGAIAALMLSWPFEKELSDRSRILAELMKDEMATFSPDTKNEIALLRTQLLILIGCSRPLPKLDRIDSQHKCSQKKNCKGCLKDVQL